MLGNRSLLLREQCDPVLLILISYYKTVKVSSDFELISNWSHLNLRKYYY